MNIRIRPSILCTAEGWTVAELARDAYGIKFSVTSPRHSHPVGLVYSIRLQRFRKGKSAMAIAKHDGRGLEKIEKAIAGYLRAGEKETE